MIHHARNALTLLLLFSAYQLFACENRLEYNSSLALQLYAANQALETAPTLPTIDHLRSCWTLLDTTYYSANEELQSEVRRNHAFKQLNGTNKWYKIKFNEVSQLLIIGNNQATIAYAQSLKKSCHARPIQFLHYPFALENCIQVKTTIDACGNNKNMLLQEMALLESAPKRPKTDLSVLDIIKYQMFYKAVASLQAQEELDYAIIELAVVAQENEPYSDLAHKTYLFLAKATNEQTVTEAQELIEQAKALPNPYYAIFCTKNEDDGEYGLKQVHDFLLEHTK